MNIFFLDQDINTAAKYHVDKHVVKMRLELCQLACTAHWQSGGQAPYRQTHKNHPSAVWTRQSIDNYRYVVTLGLALCRELRHRFGTNDQLCEKVLFWCLDNEPNIDDLGFTSAPSAMDDQFKIHNFPCTFEQTVENYRNYYQKGKVHLHKWTNRDKPNWL